MAQKIEEPKNQPLKPHHDKTVELQGKKDKSTTPEQRSFLDFITIVIAMVGFIFSMWAMHNNYVLQNTLADKDARLDQALNQIESRQLNIKNQIATQVANKTNGIKQAQELLQNKLNGLNQQMQSAMNQKFYQKQDWLLLKSRYYLELAQINAHWSDNYKMSISLLQQADNLLESFSDSKVFAVRQAIAKEIAQLKAIPSMDTVGLLGQIDAIQDGITHLSFKDTVFNELKNDSSDSATSPKDTAQTAGNSHWRDSINILKKMVIIRRDNESITPLMSPLYEAAVKESVSLNLQEAQWAILNQSPEVYQLALNHAILNFKRLFNCQLPHTNALLKQLTDLQKIKINPERPTLEFALPLLNQIIESQELLIKPSQDDSKGVQ